MVDVGVDIWQGTLRTTNDIPALIDRFGGQIAFMGGIESQIVDKPDWTREEVRAEVDAAIAAVGRTTGFIPCLTSGLDSSGYPGVYDAVSAEIDRCSARDFA